MPPVQNYQVFVTPLVSQDTYGTEIDITKAVDLTDLIQEGGIGKIKLEVDNGDYDFGVFTFANINLKTINYDGKFNEPQDWRSIFRFTRDLAKIDIEFFDSDGNQNISFRGIINDEATRTNFSGDEVTFKVLAYDSVLRKTPVPGGAIDVGDSFTTAITSILNRPAITRLLNFDPAKINVQLDLTIDDADPFENLSTKDALDRILLAGNSILVIDVNNDMTVRSRQENSNVPFVFFGNGNLDGRDNIIDIKNLNPGTQRAFNSIVINETESKDDDFIAEYSLRQKTIRLDFITDTAKEGQIADRLLEFFKVPKKEFEFFVKTNDAKDVEILDRLKVEFRSRVRPDPNSGSDKLTLYGTQEYGDFSYPLEFGTIQVFPNELYKVIGIQNDPKSFITRLKVRNVGKIFSDGVEGALWDDTLIWDDSEVWVD